MTATTEPLSAAPAGDDDLDAIIIGAGISGICAGHHLRKSRPKDRFLILEARDAIGGTWDLFRYPGVRSDSDMFTLGFTFRPWSSDRAIAEGETIRTYLEDTARETGLTERMRFGHRVLSADWSSETARWRLEVETPEGRRAFRCRFLFVGAGYYAYDKGHDPSLPGRDAFRGQVIHPQDWPEDAPVDGARIAVIGSGATAVTLVPALAERAAHVTMVQRTPSFIGAVPARDAMATRLLRWLPGRLAHPLIRWKSILISAYLYRLSRRKPEKVRGYILKAAREAVGPGHDVETDFNPPYDPWDQRFCLAPDGDIFAAIREGSASVATSAAERFTETGVRLADGREIEADIVVTATGLRLRMLGGMRLSVDGASYDIAQGVSYKGAMLSGLPNLVVFFGYTNASWTLKTELVAAWAMRLLARMQAKGVDSATPVPPEGMTLSGFLPLASGYVTRAKAMLPQQGDRAPWRVHQNYFKDIAMFRFGRVDDPDLRYARAGTPRSDRR